MNLRVVSSLIVALAVLGIAWFAVAAGGSGGPDARHPVVVGAERVAAGDLEARALREVGGVAGRLDAGRRIAADAMMEQLWLRREAAERGVYLDEEAVARELEADRRAAGGERPWARFLTRAGLTQASWRRRVESQVLRRQVADALARSASGPGRFAAAFDSFHARWRERTRCLPAYHDPFVDRCGDQAPAPQGTCRWMGEAGVCEVAAPAGRAWLVVQDVAAGLQPGTPSKRRRRQLARRRAQEILGAQRGDLRRLSDHVALGGQPGTWFVRIATREGAAAVAEAVYRAERAAREREAREARQAAERRRRLADPRLSSRTIAAAQKVCERYDREMDPYLFGAGLQDLPGQAEGFLVARSHAARRFPRTAVDDIDRGKLKPLLRALRHGNGFLVRIHQAATAGDLETAYAFLSEFDTTTRREESLAKRLGLRDCLISPTSAKAP